MDESVDLEFEDILDTSSATGSTSHHSNTTPPSSRKRKREPDGNNGSSTGICLMPKCELVQKKNSRWCTFHQGHVDNMRWFQEHNKVSGSEENRKNWCEKMKDPNFAISQIEKHEAENAGISKWKCSSKQHLLLAWQEESGHRTSENTGVRTVPYEKEEFILKMIRKKRMEQGKGQPEVE